MNSLFLTQRPLWIFLSLLSFVSLSCQKSDDNVAVPKSITDQILEDNQFSLLRAAIKYADVGDALKGGNLTLFAPVDAAFQAAGLTTEAAIQALPKQQVRQLVLYHALLSPVASTGIPDGLNSVSTVSGGVAYINKLNSGTVYFNNAQVIQPDIVVTNGYIYTINRLLTPSTGTMLMTIQNNPNLTFLTAALRRIASTNRTLTGTLDGTTSTATLTLFAPSDDAFRTDGRFSSVNAIDTANQTTLSNLLLYHTASGVVFSNQLLTGTITTMLNSNKLVVTVTPSEVRIRGNRNAVPAVIRAPDITTSNGVIHIVDQVLQP